jgi:tumor protein p53-inducible protein 3
VPDNLSFEQAAAIPEAYMTAYQALFWLGGLKKKQNVLIHAGASGVGLAATQLAKQEDSKIFVTAGGPAKCQFCSSLGIQQAIDYKAHANWDRVVMESTANTGVDLIVDFVGASYFSKNLSTLNTDGTLVILALLSGSTVADPTNIGTILRKRLNIKGSTLRNRDQAYKEKLSQEFWSYAKPLFASGSMLPVIDSVLPWDKVAEAHTRMENNANIGKIVITIN